VQVVVEVQHEAGEIVTTGTSEVPMVVKGTPRMSLGYGILSMARVVVVELEVVGVVLVALMRVMVVIHLRMERVWHIQGQVVVVG
jgi:hypothetical protein